MLEGGACLAASRFTWATCGSVVATTCHFFVHDMQLPMHLLSESDRIDVEVGVDDIGAPVAKKVGGIVVNPG